MLMLSLQYLLESVHSVQCSCERLIFKDSVWCVELWLQTSESEYNLLTHSGGARISGSQLTTTPTLWPFLSMTTSPTRRNTYGGRGLRTVLEAAEEKQENPECSIQIVPEGSRVLISLKGLAYLPIAGT